MSEAATLLLKLTVAHVVGDFVLQSDTIAQRKRSFHGLLWHGAIHAVCLAVVWWSEAASPGSKGALVGLLVAHLAIDRWTTGWETNGWSRLVVDQALHALTIMMAVSLMRPAELGQVAAWVTATIRGDELWLLLLGAGVTTWVGAVAIRLIVTPYTRQLAGEPGSGRPGLEAAGRLIGILERSIVFFAITMRVEALVGFVVAAKAILRLPEAREGKSHALAEYYLIGSLASLLWAILFASLTRYALSVSGTPAP